MRSCENCGQNHTVQYGSGRFCSSKCARGFSTKQKRKEINEKVSKKLKRERTLREERTCQICKKKFIVKITSTVKTCSVKCGAIKGNSYIEKREKLSQLRIEALKRGIVNGKSKKYVYFFKGDSIRCDSKIEYACCNYFDNLGADNIKRCDFHIEYKINDVVHRFLPDFIVSLKEKIYIVEAKSYVSLKTLNEKWRKYNELSLLKKKILEEFCEKNGYESFWFTKDLNIKFYTQSPVA